MKPKLSPAQRTMLHNAIHGRPLATSLTRNSTAHKTHSTVQALHRAGMLAGIDHKPTAAGLAFFEPDHQAREGLFNGEHHGSSW